MSRFLRTYWKPIAAIIGLGIISGTAAVIILGQQRFYLPKWVPFLGRDLVTYTAQFSTAQSVTPGQGQIVTIAGVRIGDITGVQLRDGRADVEMKLERRYTPLLRQDASALLRPKTGLKDMTLELDPGSRSAPRARPGFTIPVSRTAPNVDVDEFLRALDGDTRGYLQLLLAAGADGLRGRSQDLGDGLRQFQPVSRDLRRATSGLADRRRAISGGVTSLGQVVGALDDQRGDVNRLVSASADVFGAFANQEASLRRSLNDLPPALRDTRRALDSTRTLAEDLRPASRDLRPLARELGPALRTLRPFVRRTEPVIRRQLLPFTRDTLPAVRDLRAAARDVNRATPDTVETLKIANDLLDILAYDPPGAENQGYLFYFGWVNHLGANIFANQDANGAVRRGQIIATCRSLDSLELAPVLEPILGPVVGLLNAPQAGNESCTTAQAAGRGVRLTDDPPEDESGSSSRSGEGSAAAGVSARRGDDAAADGSGARGGERADASSAPSRQETASADEAARQPTEAPAPTAVGGSGASARSGAGADGGDRP